MPIGLSIPTQYAGQRMQIPHFWQPGDWRNDYSESFYETLIDVTGTVCLPNGEASQAQQDTLVDIGIAAGGSPAIRYSIRVQPYGDGFITSNDPRDTSGDSASLAFQQTKLQTRLDWLATKGVACTHLHVDCEIYSESNAPSSSGDPSGYAAWIAARYAKYAAYAALVESMIPGVTQHWFAFGWAIPQITSAGVDAGWGVSQYSRIVDPATVSSSILFMPDRYSRMFESIERRSVAGVDAGLPVGCQVWLGTRRNGYGASGDPQDYDEDYGDTNAFILGRELARTVRPDEVLFYPGPGLANVYASYGELNPLWWQHANAYIAGWFEGEPSGDVGRLSRSNRILGQTMPTLLTLWVDNDTTILIEGLRESFTGALQNNLTNVTATILDDDGAALSPPIIISMAYVSGSDGNYLATIPDTTALTPDKNYLVVIDANAGDGMVGKWRLRAVARRRNE